MSENSLGIPGINAPTTSKPKGKSEMGRNKVLLKPGKGLLDWIRLSNAGRMTPHPPAKSVDHLELSRHNTENDCWILLFDMVYDVTQYLEFHPGGIPQLMRAAGTDGTNLFNEYHRWVNYKNMLKSCVIGPFTGARDKLQPPKDPLPTEIINLNIASSNSN